jgi:hypothetical protein
MSIKIYKTCLLLLLSAVATQAQIPDSIPGERQFDAIVTINEYDSIEVFYFYADNPGQEYAFGDTLLNNHFQQYDPLRQQGRHDANLGWLGTAHRSIVYEPYLRKGFDIGLHQFDRYKMSPTQLKYFHLQKAWTDLYFSQSLQQNDGLIKAAFGRDFADGVHFAVDYSRTNNINASEIRLLTTNIYDPPTARNTSISSGLWIERPRYDGFLSYTANIIQQRENGGIRDDSIFLIDLDFKTAEHYLDEAFTKHTDNTLAYIQHYRFSGGKDSLSGTPKRDFRASHSIQYNIFRHKYADTAPDTTYYQPDLLTDTRGMRMYLSAKTLENTFTLGTFRLRSNADSSGGSSQRDLLEVGLLHRWISLNQEPLDSNLQNLMLTGKWNYTPNDRLRLETAFHYGLLFANSGDYRVSGNLSIDLPKIGGLTLVAQQQRYEPSLTSYRMYLTQRLAWENDYKKTLETNLSAALRIAPLSLEVKGTYHLLNNAIYYDTTAVPVQSGIPVSIFQLGARWNLRLATFHLDNDITLQQATEDFVRLPRLVSVNSLYYEGKWFKKVLLMRIGFDLRYNDAYYGTSYLPLTGQFYLQDAQRIRMRAVDFFISSKVRGFRLFAKMENILPFLTDEVFYQVPYYPQPDLYFRLGISWHLHQ